MPGSMAVMGPQAGGSTELSTAAFGILLHSVSVFTRASMMLSSASISSLSRPLEQVKVKAISEYDAWAAMYQDNAADDRAFANESFFVVAEALKADGE